MVLLLFNGLASYLIIVLKLSQSVSVDGKHPIDPKISMILAILSIFVAATDVQISEKVKTPGAYLMASVIFKILKAVMTIVVFSVNGNTNDVFVAFFFLTVSINGIIYLYLGGYRKVGGDMENEAEQ